MHNKVLSTALALLTASLLFACAPDSERPTVYLLSNEWEEISLVEADLTLFEELPVSASSLHRRGERKSEIEDFFVFSGSAGIEGYVMTSRRPGRSFPEETMLGMRQARLFHAYARQQPETLEHRLKIGIVYGFPKDHPHTVGHYTTALNGTGPGTCFLARIGLLLADDGAGLPPAAIDTIVQVALCGDQVEAEQLVTALRETAVKR